MFKKQKHKKYRKQNTDLEQLGKQSLHSRSSNQQPTTTAETLITIIIININW